MFIFYVQFFSYMRDQKDHPYIVEHSLPHRKPILGRQSELDSLTNLISPLVHTSSETCQTLFVSLHWKLQLSTISLAEGGVREICKTSLKTSTKPQTCRFEMSCDKAAELRKLQEKGLQYMPICLDFDECFLRCMKLRDE